MSINNAFYDDLGTMWYESDNHPIALLRAENALRNPWIAETVHEKIKGPATVLDIGCGGGFLTNFLASKGHKVHGIDLSTSSLKIAKENDKTGTVVYQMANAYSLPYPSGAFDAVSAMDIIEHVEHPEKLIREAARVLKPFGLFFFHTFNRNPLSYLLVIKAVEWLVPNSPPNIHVYPLFVKPDELSGICEKNHLAIEEIKGVLPNIDRHFWKSLCKRKVEKEFSFSFCKSLLVGYSGYCIKRP